MPPPTVPECVSNSAWKGKEVDYCLLMCAAFINVSCTLMILKVASRRFHFASLFSSVYIFWVLLGHGRQSMKLVSHVRKLWE